MFKNLFTAALLFASSILISTSANATLMGIDGEFEMFVGGNVKIAADGSVSEIYFNSLLVGFSVSEKIKNGQDNDFYGRLLPFSPILVTTNPLVTASVVAGTSLWSVAGFEFFITEIVANQTAGTATGIKIIGTLTHEDFADTKSEYFISGQNLTVGDNLNKTLSASVTSPAPKEIPEPGTLAIFALGLMGFAANRKKKSF